MNVGWKRKIKILLFSWASGLQALRVECLFILNPAVSFSGCGLWANWFVLTPAVSFKGHLWAVGEWWAVGELVCFDSSSQLQGVSVGCG